MSGHNKWSKIKRQKASTDGQKSKIFGKYARLITTEAKKSGADSPTVRAIVEKARKENMPNDNIDRAIKKATETGGVDMVEVVYEAYGPGGCALIIEGLTENRNKAAQEVRHILSKNGGYELAATGSASWAFTKNTERELVPTMTVPLSDADGELLSTLIDALEDNDEVQAVYTNAE